MPARPAEHPVLVSAVMIVKDEEAALPHSLPPLLRACDEVVVADTGSCDATAQIARDLGARVVDVPWTGSFAHARNRAAQHARGAVVVVVDADEVLVGSRADVHAAADLLVRWHAAHRGQALVATVPVLSESDSGGWSIDGQRIYLRGAVRYWGRAHERLLTADGTPPHVVRAPGLSLAHSGYGAGVDEVAKALRNVELLAAELGEIDATDPSSPRRPWLLVDLGRTLPTCGRLDEALALLAEAAGGDDRAAALAARDFAARALIAAGLLADALDVVDALVQTGADDDYAAYLYGQMAALAGDGVAAVDLLSRADAAARDGRLHDCSGRVLGPTTVTEMLALAHELVAVQRTA